MPSRHRSTATVPLSYLLVVLFLCAGTQPIRAQSGMRSVHAVSTGGGTSVLDAGVASIFSNPSQLTMGGRESRFELQLFRVGGYSGGDLFQFEHYSDLFVHDGTTTGPLSDADEKAVLDDWFDSSMRSAGSYFEVIPLAVSYRPQGAPWAVGGAVRGRVIQKLALNRGLFDLLLRGTDTDRTVPVNLRTRAYSTVDLTGSFSYRFSEVPLSVGVSPRLILGTGYADAVLHSTVDVADHTLTHHFDYTGRAAGALSTGLYDTFDAFDTSPIEEVIGTSSGVAGVGGGVDVGLTYALQPSVFVSARVTDIGWIRWTEHAQTVTPAENRFRFDGISLDLHRLREEYGGEVSAYVKHQLDSLARASYQDVRRDRSSFRTGLPTAVHVSTTWAPGAVTLDGGASVGVNPKAGPVPRTVAVHLGGELPLGPVALRTGVRFRGAQAMTVSGGLGMTLGAYSLDLGGSVTPTTSFLGAGARYAVSVALGTIRL